LNARIPGLTEQWQDGCLPSPWFASTALLHCAQVLERPCLVCRGRREGALVVMFTAAAMLTCSALPRSKQQRRACARQSVLAPSQETPATATIRGWDFNDGCSLDGIMGAMLRTGCQATALGQAVDEINRMVRGGQTPRCNQYVECSAAAALNPLQLPLRHIFPPPPTAGRNLGQGTPHLGI